MGAPESTVASGNCFVAGPTVFGNPCSVEMSSLDPRHRSHSVSHIVTLNSHITHHTHANTSTSIYPFTEENSSTAT